MVSAADMAMRLHRDALYEASWPRYLAGKGGHSTMCANRVAFFPLKILPINCIGSRARLPPQCVQCNGGVRTLLHSCTAWPTIFRRSEVGLVSVRN